MQLSPHKIHTTLVRSFVASTTGFNTDETIEGVALFTYLGRPLDQSENYWPGFRRSIREAWQVWGKLVINLRREGADYLTSETFYRAVV